MGTVLTLAVSIYFFMISYRLHFAYFFFVFFIPFLPKYIGFGVGSEGFALSLKRILLMLLFMWFALSLTQNWEYIVKRISLVYQQNKMLINLLLLLFVVKVISLTFNSRELSLYIMLFDDFLFSIFIYILTISVINSEETIHRLMKTIFYGYAIVLVFVLVESFIKTPMLSIFASGQMQLSRNVSEAFIREGNYRTVGSFTGPIILGNYLVVLFPVIFAYVHKNISSLIFKIIFLMLFIYAIYSTGSRSPMLITLIGIYIFFIAMFYKGSYITRLFFNILNLIIISVAVYFIFNYISDLLMNFSGRFDLITDDAERSSTSRALQYIYVFDKIQEAPFWGFGRERNYTEVLEFAIDNYFFWLILEVGLIGISIYFLYLFTLIKTALSQYKLHSCNYYLLALLVSIILMILYQVLSAVMDNHIYLYIFAGIVSVMKVLQNDEIRVHHNISDTINMNKRNMNEEN